MSWPPRDPAERDAAERDAAERGPAERDVAELGYPLIELAGRCRTAEHRMGLTSRLRVS